MVMLFEEQGTKIYVFYMFFMFYTLNLNMKILIFLKMDQTWDKLHFRQTNFSAWSIETFHRKFFDKYLFVGIVSKFGGGNFCFFLTY